MKKKEIAGAEEEDEDEDEEEEINQSMCARLRVLGCPPSLSKRGLRFAPRESCGSRIAIVNESGPDLPSPEEVSSYLDSYIL